MFNPPASPTNGAEYTYGNVTWEYSNPPGAWNIKDGTLVGTNGIGVSGFFVAQEGDPNFDDGHLYFYYIYPDGVTSDYVDAGSVITQANVVPADPGITFTDSFALGDRITLGETVVLTGESGTIRIRNAGSNTFRFDTRMASDSLTGVASFNNAYFTVSGAGQVSLVSGVTGDTVTGPNAAIIVSKSGKVATIDARLAKTDGTTGVASFNDTHFSVSTAGVVSLSNNFAATGDTVTGPNAAIIVSKSGKVATIDARLATNTGTTGVAGFTGADFNVLSGIVSLTAGIVRSVNGVTGEVAKGTPANRVFYSNAAKGLTTSDKLLFDGTSLTFSGTNFNLGSVNMIGGVFSQHKEKGTAVPTLSNNTTLTLDPADGYYQKIKWDTSAVSGTLSVTVSDNNWTNTANQVESIVAVILQVGKGLSAQFSSKILNEGNRYFMGSTGSVDVITVSRYAIDSTNGLTMGFIIAKGMTSGGFKFD